MTARDIGYTLSGFAESFGTRPLNQLGPAAIDRYLDRLATMSVATRRNYLSRVHHFTDWLLHQGKITRDPFAEFKPIHQPEPIPATLSADELALLRASLPDNRARAVVALEHRMGLRAGEVARLTTRDWDQLAGVMKIRGKGERERFLPVPTDVRLILLAYLAEVGERPGPLIRSVTKPWAGVSPRTLSAYARQWMYDAGVKHGPLDGRSGHALRRTGATELCDASNDVRLVQSFLGHADLNNLKHYLKRAELGRLREAMEARPPPAEAA